MDALQRKPIVEWGPATDTPRCTLQRLYFHNESYQGHPTRVFAYLARPRRADGEFPRTAPGIVLVHGGAGKAFAEWAEQWATYGYVALAMDLNGRDDQGRPLNDGGPIMGEESLITGLTTRPIRDMWPYQAIAAAIRSITILTHDPAVKTDEVGVMGISWGSYAAGIVAGLDHRVAFAILAYGCGFFLKDSAYRQPLEAMPEKARAAWVENFDQSRYLPDLKAPVFWLTDTNDHFFPLECWTRSQQITHARSTTLRVLPDWRHGYAPVWNTAECRQFADEITRQSEPLVRVIRAGRTGDQLWAEFPETAHLQKSELVWTGDTGEWERRSWHVRAVKVDPASHRVSVGVQPGTTAAFLNLTDVRGMVTSGPCWIGKGG